MTERRLLAPAFAAALLASACHSEPASPSASSASTPAPPVDRGENAPAASVAVAVAASAVPGSPGASAAPEPPGASASATSAPLLPAPRAAAVASAAPKEAASAAPAAPREPGPGEPAAAPEPPVPPSRGAVASGESYTTWLETSGGYRVGAPASVRVVLNAKEPFHCNAQYPYKLALEPPPDGVGFPAPLVRGMQVEGQRGTMSVPFTVAKAGTFTLAGTLSFSTCTKDRCLVDKARISVAAVAR